MPGLKDLKKTVLYRVCIVACNVKGHLVPMWPDSRVIGTGMVNNAAWLPSHMNRTREVGGRARSAPFSPDIRGLWLERPQVSGSDKGKWKENL